MCTNTVYVGRSAEGYFQCWLTLTGLGAICYIWLVSQMSVVYANILDSIASSHSFYCYNPAVNAE